MHDWKFDSQLSKSQHSDSSNIIFNNQEEVNNLVSKNYPLGIRLGIKLGSFVVGLCAGFEIGAELAMKTWEKQTGKKWPSA